MFRKNEITIRGERFLIPAPYYAINKIVGFEVYDETGVACTFFESGDNGKVSDGIPYFITSYQKMIRLTKI